MLDQILLYLDRERLKKDGEMGSQGAGGLIISNISIKGEIIRGRQLIKGQLLFEEIGYLQKDAKITLIAKLKVTNW